MNVSSDIVVSDVTYTFAHQKNDGRDSLPVLDGVSFSADKGSVLSVLGPSGSGKTTLLRCVAGLLMPESGEVRVGGRPVVKPGPDRMLLFQELHLFYWMTVRAHVDFSLRARGVDANSAEELARDVLAFVGLEGFEQYYPTELSGGMRQRLALARALAADPAVLLMDEPFGSLDADTRQQLEMDFLELLHRREVTTIVVTHDIRQAVFMSDRIVLMTHRPAKVLEVIDVPFGRPRNAALRREPKFHDLEDGVAEAMARKPERGLA
jgi:NitT/TauT family transport system ATP-binding protein